MIGNKYLTLINDLGLDNTRDNYKKYVRLGLEKIIDYDLCKNLMKQKNYINAIRKLQRKYKMLDNGVMNLQLVSKLNFTYLQNMFINKEQKD